MDNKSQGYLQKLNQKLDQLFKELDQYAEAELNQSPKQGAWSVMDILHHLKLVEFHANAYVKKKLSFDPDLPKIDFQSKMRATLMNAFNRSPLKRKAPKAVAENSFPKDVPFQDLKQQWLAQRKDLEQHLLSLPEDLYHKQVYKHPFAGRMSLSGMLSFFDSHFDRHHRQIRRTLGK